jgi:hypothetical protein
VTEPRYWMYETSGVLRPVVEKYLRSEPLDARELGIMRAYLRQWMAGPWEPELAITQLRTNIDGIKTTAHLTEWLSFALDAGVDPL